jgi:hypothetical protein
MFIKEEDTSHEDIYTTSVVTEVQTEDTSQEVEDVSLTLLLFFCTFIVLFTLFHDAKIYCLVGIKFNWEVPEEMLLINKV